MKYINFTVLQLIFLFFISFSCDSIDNTTPQDVSDTKIEKTGFSPVQEIDVQENLDIFNMNPIPELEELSELPDFLWPSLKYYSGSMGKYPIQMILDENDNGVYIYNNSGKSFSLNIKPNNYKDSLIVVRSKNESNEIFEGILDNKSMEYTGLWTKDGESLPFRLKEQINTPQQVQLFINLNTGVNFANTDKGIVIANGNYKSTDFNSFYCQTEIGEGYDTGQEWEISAQQIFFYDSSIVYVNSEILNTISDVGDGTENSMIGKFYYKVITEGIVTEKEVILEGSDKNTYSTWLFKDYIVIISDDDDSVITYQFNKFTETFELINE